MIDKTCSFLETVESANFSEHKTRHLHGTLYDQLKATRRSLRFTAHGRERLRKRRISEMAVAAAVLFGARELCPRVGDDRKEFRCVLTAAIVERLRSVIAVPLRVGLVVTIGGNNRIITVWSGR